LDRAHGGPPSAKPARWSTWRHCMVRTVISMEFCTSHRQASASRSSSRARARYGRGLRIDDYWRVRSRLEKLDSSSFPSNDRYVIPLSLARPPTPTIDGVISIQYGPRVPPGNAWQHGLREVYVRFALGITLVTAVRWVA
jgi:hypothetical protein